jgi:hypothetical protein
MKHRAEKLYDTDSLMKGLWRWLVRDFRSMMDDPSFMVEQEVNLCEIPTYRTYDGGSYMLSPYSYFKARYQLDSLFKRYKFTSDLFTADELREICFSSFCNTQLRLKSPSMGCRTFLVLQRARRIIKSILGSYNEEEHMSKCRFGKRASVGVPKRHSYLDWRTGHSLTGSRDHILWFERYLISDRILSDIITRSIPKGQPRYEECDTLTLTAVPKSFKTDRSICPNTTIGSFYTYGLGRMLQDRLTREGLDIRFLQTTHRSLAQRYSRTRECVTADLSSASDSFTSELINILLPRKWYNVLKFGRISHCEVGDNRVYLQSFMQMGIGYTFQLQTLLFYGILKSIQELSGIHGKISVYGDDLIYPFRMHHFVTGIFSDIGFILNKDKTFVKEQFRESCGGDYYCGIDVRPFQPEGVSERIDGKQYSMLLYKMVNGLLRRWNEFEIPQAIRFLYSELLRCNSVIFQVPPSFPDFSGVKVDKPRKDFLLPWSEINYDCNLSYRFAFLSLQPRKRVVLAQYIYFWEKLRQMESGDPEYHPFDDDPPPILNWEKDLSFKKRVRSKVTGLSLRKLRAVVAHKERAPSIVSQTGITVAWC